MSKEIAEEYASSLSDLTVNSKPLINMLTILAEENIDHAGVIVETVEKHLEKVPSEIKLPVLYLVDSIIKNVGGAYTQKFSQSIVNMFTKTFKQVDEKTRSQMFKLRETWHDVFPATKLYQLDVKVNLIDPAWPIQAQPHQSTIHVNPNFLKKNVPTTSTTTTAPVLTEEEEKMRSILAKKEQELLMLQRKKIEMELEHTRKQLEMAEKNVKKVVPIVPPTPAAMPVALVNPVVTPVVAPETVMLPAKARLGPPVNKPTNRIAPVSGVLAGARRDPRLARRPAPAPSVPVHTVVPPMAAPVLAVPPIAPHVFDIKPLDRITKRKNVITIDVNPETLQKPQIRDPRKRDPRFDKRRDRIRIRDRDDRKKDEDKRKVDTTNDKERKKEELKKNDVEPKKDEKVPEKVIVDKYLDKMMGPEKKVKLPPIPKINRDDAKEKDAPSPVKKRNLIRGDKKKKRDSDSSKESSSSSSPEKKSKINKEKKIREQKMEVDEKPVEPEIVPFKELKNYHKERYMRRNKEKSESPEVKLKPEEEKPAEESSNGPEVVSESKDVDLRVLPAVEKAAPIAQKRPSTEILPEGKIKKNKLDKFDILFGNEDVDLRQLPQVEEVAPTPMSPKEDIERSPERSPKKDWHEVKEKEEKKTPTKLDLVRAKLAEATKGKDRLGRPLLFSKASSEERERRRTLSSEDTDLRNENPDDFDAEDHKKTISIIMSQAKEQYSDGQLDKGQYNALMYQVLQLNEKLKLKEAKQRESLECSKRKLKAQFHEEPQKVVSPKSTPNTFGDIDERINPAVFIEVPKENKPFMQDSDMRMNVMDSVDGQGIMPPPNMPMFMRPYWRGQPRQRVEEYVPRMYPRGPNAQFFRGQGQFDARLPRPAFEPRMPMHLPMPQIGMGQGDCPLKPYERCSSPPPLGSPGITIPPTDIQILEYIDHDPVKTIQIDGVPREIRFYGETAVIMLDWDDPREIKFLPGCRRVTFDNKDSVVLSFNEPYKQVEIDDQVFDIRFGAPTRELYINGRWFECFFGGQPLGVLIDGKPRLVHLEGPLPQVDIGKVKRTDLVAGKINLIVNATQMCPVYLDAKVQKFMINGHFFTIRFVDALRTVLINEQPFKVEFGDLPKPIFLRNEKFFIRFSALPRNIKPGSVQIANMEGSFLPVVQNPPLAPLVMPNAIEVDPMLQRPMKTPSPEGQGLDMLASVMPLPSNLETPASASEYSLAEPLFARPDKIPGLESSPEENKAQLPILGNINVTDLFAKLVATGIVQMPNDKPKDVKDDKLKSKEDRNLIRKVDLLKPETFRVAQPGVVSRLYGGMQCSGCGARFPPEHTVRYSQHLDWHFRQNRRERDSARRPHARHWYYDLADWLNYEELEDADEREKSWFESGGLETTSDREEETPSTPAVSASTRCALCGDSFDQFYNEDKEEWHLRNSVVFEEKNYHPVCLEDYKASLAKESEKTKEETKEAPKEETAEEKRETVAEQEKTEPIEIDAEEENENETAQSSESEVEVIEEKNEPVEIDEEADEDDVVFKAEPIVQVEVDDEADTDDETLALRAARDQLHDFTKVKVKQEPIDPDDEPIIMAEEEVIPTTVDSTLTTVTSSIDGNVQLEAPIPAATLPIGGIRINISKSMPTSTNTVTLPPVDDRMLEDVSADDEPLPPGEEPELEFKLKPSLEGVKLSRQPPVQKGNDLSGLCSIM